MILWSNSLPFHFAGFFFYIIKQISLAFWIVGQTKEDFIFSLLFKVKSSYFKPMFYFIWMNK